MIKITDIKQERLLQGDIIQNVEYIEYIEEESGILNISKVIFPYVIVLTQDCDLQQDYEFRCSKKSSQDKYLISILVAPLYNFEHFCQGDHLIEIGIKSSIINKKKTPGENLIKNQTPRYHYLDFGLESPVVPSVIDFKHYFSISTDIAYRLKKQYFVFSVSQLYREDISHRFASFLSRIGLP